MKKANRSNIAVLDFETDPFAHGRIPEAFCGAVYSEDFYIERWGADCVLEIYKELNKLKKEYVIYAHNGGKFDFYFLLQHGILDGPIKIINGRIVCAKLGKHELRDSFAIYPLALSSYKKDEIDYSLFEHDKREANKNDILHYLATDCEYLHELVCEFNGEFGDNLTVGGTAIKEIKKYHAFKTQNDKHDERFRPFFFGGRTQCFETGHIESDLFLYDVNSMYPSVMRDYQHPTGDRYKYVTFKKREKFFDNGIFETPATPYFIKFVGENNNALPYRIESGKEKGGLTFQQRCGVFSATSHEIQIALKHGLIHIDKILEMWAPVETINFKNFVETYVDKKIKAKQNNDKLHETFYKLIMNSGYGKFAQNPANFFDYKIHYSNDKSPRGINDGWELYHDLGYCEIWRKPATKPVYNDVATAASITGAARAVLLDAIANSKRPLYCDTDSLICERLDNVVFDKFALGAWDLEHTGDDLYISSKKMYALFDRGVMVKKACKGVKFDGCEIIDASRGIEVEYKSDAPTFKLSGNHVFTERTINKKKTKNKKIN